MRDLDVFKRVHGWLAQSQTVWLCTVLATWGSSPRPVGSLLACNNAGEYVGSLSGGCVEEDLLARISAGEFAENIARLCYGASAAEAERLRLPCGGILDVAIEMLRPSVELLTSVDAIMVTLAARQRIEVCRDFAAGVFLVAELLDKPSMLTVQQDNSGRLLKIQQCLGPQYRLLLIGISEVSRAVAQMALLLDYEIMVCDPRADARARWDIAGVTVLADMPDDAVRRYGDDDCCAILALTHDPRIDDMGLMEAFNTQAFYIGAMGSLRTSEKRRERLMLLDVSAGQLQRLHAPIGLDTGSKTPTEIALSVLAQLTAVRNGK
jgi:xanthine dehydrogenase accessory factor